MPAPLKGISLITTGPYHDPGVRMLTDLDVLVSPHELRRALQCLRSEGYRQINNLFDPPTLTSSSFFQPLDPDDFRNSLLYCRHHVPMIVDEDAGYSIELHIATAFQDSEAGLYLNSLSQVCGTIQSLGDVQHRITPDTFKLLNVFYASQLMDRLQERGRIDWRHLIDAELLIRGSIDPELVAECFRHATNMGEDHSFFTFLEQVRMFVAKDLTFDEFATDARRKHAREFIALSTNPSRRRFADLADYVNLQVQAFSPSALRNYYGPVPYSAAVYRRLRYRLHQVLVRAQGIGKN